MGTLTPRSINFNWKVPSRCERNVQIRNYILLTQVYYDAIYRFVHVSFLCPETVLEIKIVMEGFIIIYRKMKKFFYN